MTLRWQCLLRATALAAPLILAPCHPAQAADAASTGAQYPLIGQLVGQQWPGIGNPPNKTMHALAPGCVFYHDIGLDDGSGSGRDFIAYGYSCNKRLLVMLVHSDQDDQGKQINTVADILMLPELKRGEGFWSNGICAIDNAPRKGLFTIAGFGKHKQIDARTGVRAAWTFDLVQRKIVSTPSDQVTCTAN